MTLKILTLAIAIVMANTLATAEAAPKYGRGYVPETEEVYKSFPSVPRYRAFLPKEVDLSARFPPPGNQGSQGSCTAWATGYALRSYHEGKNQTFSPSYIYNQLTTNGECVGTSIARALDLLKTDGTVPFSVFPYSVNDCKQQPDAQMKSIAGQYRIKSWRSLDASRLDDAKGQLAAGTPIVFGMNLSDSFEKLQGNSIYDDTESLRTGGHAMVLVGYSEDRQAFKFINSWGTDWADKGFGWVSFRAMQALSNRQYVIEAINPPQPTPPVPVVLVEPPKPPALIDPPKPPISVEPQPPVPVAPVVPPTPIVPPKVFVTKTKPPTLAETRALVAARVSQAACAKIDATVANDRSIQLSGFIGEAKDLNNLRADLAALEGVTQVTGDPELRPWPQCEISINFAETLAVRKGLTIALKGGRNGTNNYQAGDSMSIEVTTPSYPSYLYVSYLQASGEVVHLSWPAGRFPKPLPANSRLTFGGGTNGQPVYRIGPPFGDEVVIVTASASPLFEAPLPETANDRDFLTAFRRAFVLKPKSGGGQRVVSTVAAPIHTQSKQE